MNIDFDLLAICAAIVICFVAMASCMEQTALNKFELNHIKQQCGVDEK